MEITEKLKSEILALTSVFDEFQPLSDGGSFDAARVRMAVEKMIDVCEIEENRGAELKSWLEKNEFYSSPASTRFHGNVKGGLACHSLAVAYQALTFALPLFENFSKSHRSQSYSFTAADIFLAALAHDFCKAGFYSAESRRTKNFEGNWVYETVYKVKSGNRTLGHGNESVLRFLSIFPEYIEKRPVLEAISRHMGMGDLSENESFNYSNFLQNPLVILIQLADQTASQWFDV